MKKIAFFVLFLCLAIGAASAYPVNSTGTAEMRLGEMLVRAFREAGAEAEGYYVHNWSIVNRTFMKMDDLAEMANKLNSTLQIPDAREYRNSDSRQHVYQLHGRWDPATAVSIVLTSMNLQEQQPQTVLVVKIERDSGRVQDIEDSIEKIKNTVAKIGAAPQISTCIKGFRSDRIDSMERDRLVERVFAAVGANETEGIRSESLTSVSGYSPLVKEYITTNGKRMNLQVAVHYDAYRNNTRILIGAPIVTVEY